MRTKTLLLGILLVLPIAAANPLTALPVPAWSAESPVGTASQRVCSAEGDFCAHAQLDGALQGCSQGGTGYACTVKYVLALEGDGLRWGCLSADSDVTDEILGCRNLPYEVYEATATGEKTYYNVAADGAVTERARVCVDAGAPARERCESFSVTVRFPPQNAVAVNATVPENTQVGHASVTICRDPAASSPGCASLEVSGRVSACTGIGAQKRCTVAYTVLQTQLGVGACSTLSFLGIFDRTACGAATPPPSPQDGSVTKVVGGASRVHEEGSFCLDGDGGRCIRFAIDVPVA